jgi:Secretion system C-terminal sorting domain
MKNILSILAATLLLLCAAATTNAQGWQWAKHCADGSGSWAESLVTDKYGNVYVAGGFDYSATFGTVTIPSASQYNVFLAKYDSLGNVLWVRHTVNQLGSIRAAIDLSGDIYLAGSYDTSITFGSTTVTCANTALFLAKYDTAGNLKWVKTSGSMAAGGNITPYSICTDGQSNIYVAGNFGDGSFVLATTMGIDTVNGYVFLIKYDSSGNLIWAKGQSDQSDSSGAQIWSMAVDVFNNVYITGGGNHATTFDTFSFGSLGQGMFLVKYDTAGNVKWLRGGGGWTIYGNLVQADEGIALAADLYGNVYVAGYYDSTVTFADSTFLISGQQVFIAKYDSSGNTIWGRSTYGSNSAEKSPVALATDSAGHVYMAGYFDSTLIFGDIGFSTTSFGDVFLVEYDSSGNAFWGTASHGSGIDGFAGPSSVGVDFRGNRYLTGWYWDEPTFALGGCVVTGGSSNQEMFIAKYSNTYSVGTASVSPNRNLSLYPNPTASALYLEPATAITYIAIFDLLGREILTYPISMPVPQTLHIPLPALANGVYILKVAGADGVDYLRFVVKR